MNHALLPIVALAVAAAVAGPAAGTESVRFATFNASPAGVAFGAARPVVPAFGIRGSARVVLAGFALIALAHPDPWVAAAACIPVAGFAGYWFLCRRGDG